MRPPYPQAPTPSFETAIHDADKLYWLCYATCEDKLSFTTATADCGQKQKLGGKGYTVKFFIDLI